MHAGCLDFNLPLPPKKTFWNSVFQSFLAPWMLVFNLLLKPEIGTRIHAPQSWLVAVDALPPCGENVLKQPGHCHMGVW